MDIGDSKLVSTICEFQLKYVFHEVAQTEVSVSMNHPKYVHVLGTPEEVEVFKKLKS